MNHVEMIMMGQGSGQDYFLIGINRLKVSQSNLPTLETIRMEFDIWVHIEGISLRNKTTALATFVFIHSTKIC